MLQLGADTKLIGEIGEKDKPEFLGNGGRAPVIVDVGGGYGGGVTILLKDNGIEPTSFNGATESIEKKRDGSARRILGLKPRLRSERRDQDSQNEPEDRMTPAA